MNKLYVTDDWVFEPSTFTLKYIKMDVEQSLDPKTAHLLQYLMDNTTAVATREDIYLALYGIENARADGTITAYVSKLRKLLETPFNAKGKYIKTIPKSGYLFVGYFQILEKCDYIHQTTQEVPVSDETTPPSQPEHVSPKPTLLNSHQFLTIGAIACLALLLISLGYSDDKTFSDLEPLSQNWQIIKEDVPENKSIAMSQDGLLLAYIVRSNNSHSLVVKDTFSDNTYGVYSSNSNLIAAPAFSPDGTQLSFLVKDGERCKLNQVRLNKLGQVLPSSVATIASCGNWCSRPKLDYLDDNTLIFSRLDATRSFREIMMLDLISSNIAPLIPISESAKNEFTFAINRDTQQVAVLRQFSKSKTEVYIYDVENSDFSHVVTVEEDLRSLEWIDNKKLVGMIQDKMHLIDIAAKDIRPTNLVMLKKELGDS